MILLLETSAGVCSAALSSEGKIITIRESSDPNRHAELLSVFCDELFIEADIQSKDLKAVAVSSGPGSYTGLRIGTSTAKGYCFGLNIPLIAVPTLEAMASGMKDDASRNDLLCPLIDARRMEVYASVYDTSLEIVTPVAPVVLDENSFLDQLEKNVVWFSGDGMEKSRALLSSHPNARFTGKGLQSSLNMADSAYRRFCNRQFEDLAYFTPFYLKTFHPGPQRSAI